MSFYTYKGIDKKGLKIKGIIEGASIDEAKRNLPSSIYILTISASGKLTGRIQKSLAGRRVSRQEKIEFANNISVMLKGGMPLLLALKDMIDTTTKNKSFQQTILAMRNSIESGSSFSEAMSYHRHIFPEIYIQLVKIGEETGRLEETLKDAATHLQRVENITSSLKKALIYPVFAMIAGTGALVFWMVFVLPKIMDIFIDMGLALPLVTRVLFFASNLTADYWYVLLIMPIVTGILFIVIKKTEKGRFCLDQIKLKIPFVGRLFYYKILALYSEQLKILTAAGLPIDKSYRIIANLIDNEVYKRSINEVREDIGSGSRISEALKKHSIFPVMLIRMVSIGESSGSLDTQFGYLADYFFQKLDDISSKMSIIIEPVIIGCIGVMFAIIVIGLILPIYDIVSSVG